MTKLSLLLCFLLACGGSSKKPAPEATETTPAPEETSTPAPEEEKPTPEGTEALLCYESCVFDEGGEDQECRDQCGLERQDDDPCFADCMEAVDDVDVCTEQCG